MGTIKEGASPQNCVLFVLYAGSNLAEDAPLLQNIESIFKNEVCMKHFHTIKKSKEESGIEKEPRYWMLNDMLRGIEIVFNKKYKDQKMNKVVFIDEVNSSRLFSRDQSWCRLNDQLVTNESMYTITCVSPLLRNDETRFIKEKLEKLDTKSLLENHQIMIKQLKVTNWDSRG